ncbi:dTDP-glucose 4,6-dehydratase/UDP-glucose 4-epimerase [Catalinimonas alkaloidigena]|uniref:dTDP-glucose 4,6-dehydratase/UDP-glucose 4-epimerase n=1 Tax=Catalinimonas alkaloidigena TaxID=1075417 RepID=A0A1G9LGS4_9BACT|nr:NAD-dependent epimerase/dehydratase family protein [Catalinimonas alkaloidigena]SDL61141.1 dTDP-glucose 4,6-dehydratase/UDP-glucose 4-epimerase [Catalinimonas alkaloidigena]
MKIVIIGSKGFIGSHCLAYFRSQADIEAWGCDVVTDYVDSNYFLIDATNADYREVFRDQGFEVCINCSGAASVPQSLEHPLRDYTLNTNNVFRMLEAIRQFSPHCRFINLSSAAVYGNPLWLPITEDVPVRPLSPYGWHKQYSEQICQEFHDSFSLRTCCLRIFSAYGPGLRKQFFWDLHTKAQRNQKVELWGTGQQTRDFIYIDDLIQVIALVIKQGEFAGTIYNVANGEEVSIGEAASVFMEHYPVQADLKFSGYERPGDPLRWCADIRKIKAMGYHQQVSLTEGLKRYVQWLEEK